MTSILVTQSQCVKNQWF